ncbi:TPA: hypothetical protein ACNIJL_004659 [Pseudomonas aeruginosa]
MKKEEWIAKIKKILAAPRNEKNAIEFHELVYEAPIEEGQEVVDLLMESFLDPFDSSVMQGCITVLSGVGINEYYEAYFKIIRELLKIRETSTAIDLLDYPGHELDGNEIKEVLRKIKQMSPSGELKVEIDHLINFWNLEDEHPYSEIYFSN